MTDFDDAPDLVDADLRQVALHAALVSATIVLESETGVLSGSEQDAQSLARDILASLASP